MAVKSSMVGPRKPPSGSIDRGTSGFTGNGSKGGGPSASFGNRASKVPGKDSKGVGAGGGGGGGGSFGSGTPTKPKPSQGTPMRPVPKAKPAKPKPDKPKATTKPQTPAKPKPKPSRIVSQSDTQFIPGLGVVLKSDPTKRYTGRIKMVVEGTTRAKNGIADYSKGKNTRGYSKNQLQPVNKGSLNGPYAKPKPKPKSK